MSKTIDLHQPPTVFRDVYPVTETFVRYQPPTFLKLLTLSVTDFLEPV